MSDYFRRAGESHRDHRRRVKRGQISRVVKSFEDQGRGDLAHLVAVTQGEGVLPGVKFVTVELDCTAGHAAARVHVDTDGRFRTFERAWGEDGAGPGTWQTPSDCHRTQVSVAADGHRTVEVVCGYISDRDGLCARPVQIRMDRLRDELRGLWAPSARGSLVWRP